jgi:hypothetical protein
MAPPGDGQTIQDARIVDASFSIFNEDDAAEAAVEHDWYARQGNERGEREFAVVVISPEGEEFRYLGIHEQTISHRAEPQSP